MFSSKNQHLDFFTHSVHGHTQHVLFAVLFSDTTQPLGYSRCHLVEKACTTSPPSCCWIKRWVDHFNWFPPILRSALLGETMTQVEVAIVCRLFAVDWLIWMKVSCLPGPADIPHESKREATPKQWMLQWFLTHKLHCFTFTNRWWSACEVCMGRQQPNSIVFHRESNIYPHWILWS